MSLEDENKCKQRFKGVENFLRRVAFNLGNTPSQTEVKIISCIPIDVTDLQQKIIQLEKKLEDAKAVKYTAKDSGKDNSKEASKVVSKNVGKDIISANVNNNARASKISEVSNNTSKRASAVHTALYSSHFPRFAGAVSKAVECSQSSQAIQCEDFSDKRKKSTVSFLLSTAPTNKAIVDGLSSEKSNLISEEKSHTVLNELRRKFLKKKIKGAKKHKVKTHLVYYAQTDNTLYNSRSVTRNYSPKDTTINGRKVMDRSCLPNMVRKKYQTGTVIDELSDSSQISSPICRDLDLSRKKPRAYQSDICSCCHETFHNVDNYITRSPANDFTDLTFNMNSNRNAYYDSSLYDLIPVKEKSVRNRNDIEILKRKENKIDMKCWPENVRAKARGPSVVVNYQTVTPARNEYTKKLYTKATKRDLLGEITITQDKRVSKLDRHTAMESSKSCCVDFGELYPKPVQKAKTVIMTETMRPSHRNVECFTDAVSAVDGQTITPKLDDKTEMTLNQIKNILQSVLTEVKTNSQLKNTGDKTKKDAIIQKGASQSNLLDGSSFLNSFTYSPYNMNPYGPSCCKQMPSNSFCHPGLPHSIRYMQNYPVFIQTPGRQMCTSCYRSSQYRSCPKNTTAGTNTEEEKRGKETEKLIKEIYKAVALDVPGKDTSRSEYEDLKSARTASNKSKQMDVKDTKHLISEIFKNADMQVNTSGTHNSNTKIVYRNKDVSTHSQSETTNPGGERYNENKHVEDNTQPSTETETDIKKRKYSCRVVQPVQRIETISESTSSETSSSESESDVTTIAVKNPEKKKSGLFSKVCSLFNRNKKKKDSKVETETESESSDSDYQTIYSQKITPSKRTEHCTQRSRAHSKLHSRRSRQSQRSPETPKRSPYMEQEYRRIWNEKLMFQKTRPRYSSERPATRETTPRLKQRPIYYQNYEARSVLVDPRHYQPRYDVINRKPCLAKVNNQNRPYAQNCQNLNRVGERRVVIPPSINAVRRNTAIKGETAVRNVANAKVMAKGLSWLKSHKPRCGKQWKKFITES